MADQSAIRLTGRMKSTQHVKDPKTGRLLPNRTPPTPSEEPVIENDKLWDDNLAWLQLKNKKSETLYKEMGVRSIKIVPPTPNTTDVHVQHTRTPIQTTTIGVLFRASPEAKFCHQVMKGPRYSYSGDVVPHSILGEVHNFVNVASTHGEFEELTSMMERKKLEILCQNNFVPTKDTQPSECKHFKQWDVEMDIRKKTQKNLAGMLSRPERDLLMCNSDFYVEKKAVINNLLHEDDHFVPVQYGQEELIGCKQLRPTLTTLERGRLPTPMIPGDADAQMIEKSRRISTPWQYGGTWLNGEYLKERIAQGGFMQQIADKVRWSKLEIHGKPVYNRQSGLSGQGNMAFDDSMAVCYDADSRQVLSSSDIELADLRDEPTLLRTPRHRKMTRPALRIGDKILQWISRDEANEAARKSPSKQHLFIAKTAYFSDIVAMQLSRGNKIGMIQPLCKCHKSECSLDCVPQIRYDCEPRKEKMKTTMPTPGQQTKIICEGHEGRRTEEMDGGVTIKADSSGINGDFVGLSVSDCGAKSKLCITGHGEEEKAGNRKDDGRRSRGRNKNFSSGNDDAAHDDGGRGGCDCTKDCPENCSGNDCSVKLDNCLESDWGTGNAIKVCTKTNDGVNGTSNEVLASTSPKDKQKGGVRKNSDCLFMKDSIHRGSMVFHLQPQNQQVHHIKPTDQQQQQGCQGTAVATETTIVAYVEVGSVVKYYAVFENAGSTCIRYSWTRDLSATGLPKARPKQKVFYFWDDDGVIGPDEKHLIPMIFRSNVPGHFSETWILKTVPQLENGALIKFIFKGVARRDVHYGKQMGEVKEYLGKKEITAMCSETGRAAIEQAMLTGDVNAARQVYEPRQYCDQEMFEKTNPGFYFHPSSIRNLALLLESVKTEIEVSRDQSVTSSFTTVTSSLSEESTREKTVDDDRLSLNHLRELLLGLPDDEAPPEPEAPPEDEPTNKTVPLSRKEALLFKMYSELKPLGFKPMVPAVTTSRQKYLSLYPLFQGGVDRFVRHSYFLAERMDLTSGDDRSLIELSMDDTPQKKDKIKRGKSTMANAVTKTSTAKHRTVKIKAEKNEKPEKAAKGGKSSKEPPVTPQAPVASPASPVDPEVFEVPQSFSAVRKFRTNMREGKEMKPTGSKDASSNLAFFDEKIYLEMYNMLGDVMEKFSTLYCE